MAQKKNRDSRYTWGAGDIVWTKKPDALKKTTKKRTTGTARKGQK